MYLLPRRGFEPRFTASKAAVLPLDDLGSKYTIHGPIIRESGGLFKRAILSAYLNSMSERLIHHENSPEIKETETSGILDRANSAISVLRGRAKDLGESSVARRVLLGGMMFLGLAAAAEARAGERGGGVSFNAEARTEELAHNLEEIEEELQMLRERLERMERSPRTPPQDRRQVEGRIKVLEAQEVHAEEQMEKAAQKWTERRATQPKKQIDVAERATDETNEIIASFGIVVNKNIIAIPVGSGLYHEVVLGPEVADIGFPTRTNSELRIVLHNTDRTYTTIRVIRDRVTGQGVYSGEEQNTDARGNALQP